MKKTATVLLTFFICITSISVYAQIGKCKGKYFGNIIAYSTPSNYSTYWNQVTSENGSKWGSVEGTKGVFNFGNSDLAYNWAKNNGGLFKYHTLIWGGQAPGWIANTSPAAIAAEIPVYFKAVYDHYATMGGIKMMDVLNEPVNTPMHANLKAALTAGYQAEPANANDKNNQYGWAIWCFQLARKQFPNTTLLINEYNIEMNWNNCRTPYIAMVNAIKNAPNLTDGKKNLIDGVGLQCHGINGLSATNFKACIDEIWNKTGVAIHLTEFDVTADPDEAKQKAVYSSLIPIAWEHPHVAGITLWGYIQGSTWVGGNKVLGPGGTDTGLLYSSGYTTNPNGERPAMTWLKSYMASQPSLACCPAPGPFASCSNVNNPPTVSISSPLTNASFIAGATISLAANASDGDGTVTKVEFFNGITKLGEDASSPYTYSWTNVAAGNYTITAVATDNSANKTTSTAITVKVNVPQGPYKGTVHSIPGRIEAEEFDLGGEGFAYHEANTNGNEGKATLRNEEVDVETTQDTEGAYNVGYTLQGEWLEYSVNVLSTGDYDLDLRMAKDGDGGILHIEMDGVNVTGPITVPNTGGWQKWQTVNMQDISLTAGSHIMRIAFDASYMNLNFVEFSPVTVITGTTANESTTLKVLPNPFSEDGLKITKEGEFRYRIIDPTGVTVEEGKANNQQYIGTHLKTGIYILTVEDELGIYTQKVIKR